MADLSQLIADLRTATSEVRNLKAELREAKQAVADFKNSATNISRGQAGRYYGLSNAGELKTALESKAVPAKVTEETQVVAIKALITEYDILLRKADELSSKYISQNKELANMRQYVYEVKNAFDSIGAGNVGIKHVDELAQELSKIKTKAAEADQELDRVFQSYGQKLAKMAGIYPNLKGQWNKYVGLQALLEQQAFGDIKSIGGRKIENITLPKNKEFTALADEAALALRKAIDNANKWANAEDELTRTIFTIQNELSMGRYVGNKPLGTPQLPAGGYIPMGPGGIPGGINPSGPTITVGPPRTPQLPAGNQYLLPSGPIPQANPPINLPPQKLLPAVTKTIEDQIATEEKKYLELVKEAEDLLRKRVAGLSQSPTANLTTANPPTNQPLTPQSGETATGITANLAKLDTNIRTYIKSRLDEYAKQFGTGFYEENTKTYRPRVGTDITGIDIGDTKTGGISGITKIPVTLTAADGAVQKLNLNLLKTGEILSDDELHAKRIQEAIDRASKAKPIAPTLTDVEASIGKERAAAMYAQAQKAGFTPDQLKKLTVQMPSNIGFGEFQKVLEGGVIEKATVSVDKFGVALTHTNRRMLSFFDSIAKNTGELIKWSIGIGLVYGTMYKLQQLVTLAIENQTKLIDVNVALGKSTRDVNAIFEDAADVAKRTGENITEVLDTYVVAYRAVGGITDKFDRTGAANTLLENATILNKLSGLDAAEAIDVLAGSLRQTATAEESTSEAFKRGIVLLDQWVTVSNKANVGLGDLATAFSVTAESALNSGMSIEELNATIAVLSEKIGGLGGKETGNAVRALIGGVYQEQATTVLNQYGIAVKDSTGKMRDFMTISKDVYGLYKSGLIDETQLNKIAYVLGGGVRRGQQYVAFLKDQKRMQEIITAQNGSQGASAEALAKKMDSVQTSTVMVSNAFQTLAQALGVEGGLLETFQGLNSGLALTVDFLTLIVKLLGSVTVPAALLGLASLYTGGGKDAGRTARLMSPITWAASRIGNIGTKERAASYGERLAWGTPAGPGVTPMITEQNKISAAMGNAVQKIGPSIAVGILSALPRIIEGFNTGDFTPAGYNLGGAIVGTVLSAGSPIGTLIGSAIGDAFYQHVIDHKADFVNLFIEPKFQGVGPTDKEKETPQDVLQKTMNDLLWKKTSGDITGIPGGLFGAKMMAGMANFENSLIQRYRQMTGKPPISQKGYEIATEEGVAVAQIKRKYGEESPEYREILRLIAEVKKATPIPIEPGMEPMTIYETQMKKTFGTFFDTLVKTEREKTRAGLLTGDISPGKEYKSRQDVITGMPTTIARMYAAVHDMKLEDIKDTKAAEEEMQNYANIILNVGSDQLQVLTELSNEWTDYQKVLKETANMAADQKYEYKGIVTTVGEIRDGAAAVNQELKDTLKSLSSITTQKYPYQFMENATEAQLQAAGPQSQLYQTIRQNILAKGGKSEETGQLVFPKDTTDPIYMKADWTIVQYLLGEILKTNEKQLDGIYNLPSGASFYVPFQAWKMDTETRQAAAEKAVGETTLNAEDFRISESMFGGDTKIFGVYVDKFGNYINNLAGNLSPEAKTQLSKIAGEIKFGAKYGGWSGAPTPSIPGAFTGSEPKGPTYQPPGTGTVAPYKPMPAERPMDLVLQEQYNANIAKALEKNPTLGQPTNPLSPVPGAKDIGGLLVDFANFLRSLLGTQQIMPEGVKPWNPYETGGSFQGGFVPPANTENINTRPINTAFTLNLNSQTQLVVDGRVLADVIKPYLEQDLLSSEGSMGSSTSYQVA